MASSSPERTSRLTARRTGRGRPPEVRTRVSSMVLRLRGAAAFKIGRIAALGQMARAANARSSRCVARGSLPLQSLGLVPELFHALADLGIGSG